MKRSRDRRVAAQRRLAPKSCLILIMGVAGTGKSTLSRAILSRISAVYLDNNHIADAFLSNTRNGLKYNKLRPGFYKALYTITEANLKVGNTILLDVPHIKEVQTSNWRRFIKELVKRTGTKLIAIRCLCSEKSLRARIRARGETRDNWKLKHWEAFLLQEPIKAAIPFQHLDINTDNPSGNLRIAVRYIREQAR